MKILAEARKITDKAVAEHPEGCLVGFSGGKDSLVCMDLAMKAYDPLATGARVEAFFMETVPGLRCIEDELKRAMDRWGPLGLAQIHRVPHWLTWELVRGAQYRFRMSWREHTIPKWTLRDVFQYMQATTGLGAIFWGAKLSDSQYRRRTLKSAKYSGVYYPIIGWSKLEVLGYLRLNNIPRPDSSGRNATGVDLSVPSVLWLHDSHPEDYEKLKRMFPFVEAIVQRRAFYGIE